LSFATLSIFISLIGTVYIGLREIFRSRPDRPWGLLSLLYNGYRVSFLGVKGTGRGVDHPPPTSAEVKERVELYLYFPLWAFMACSRESFTFTFTPEILHLLRGTIISSDK
jgi:hypothetical protein